MRCSLLALSTYLDNELAPDRAGEVEAHLVACQRCSSGLGYLREEKEHIHALAAVHSDPGAAEDLLGTVGLQYLPGTAVDPPAPAPQFLLDLTESPKPSPEPPPPDESGKYLELNGSPSPKAAPELPEQVNTAAESPVEAHDEVPQPAAAEPAEASHMDVFDTHIDEDAGITHHDIDEARDDERADEAAASATPAAPAPPQWSQSYVHDPSRATREPAPSTAPPVHETPETDLVVPRFLVDDGVDATEHDMVRPEPPLPKPSTPMPSSPGVALTGRASSWFGRARDAVSVRWALMRGSSTEDIDEDDDSIQIVSGNGAPERRGARSGRGARDAFVPSASAAPDTAPSSVPQQDDKPDISFAPPEHEPLQRPAFTANERLKAQAALRKLEDEGVLTRDDEPSQGGRLPTQPAETVNESPAARSFHFDMQDPVAPAAEFPRPQPHEDEPAQPGRHQRALHRDGPRFRVPAFTPSRPMRSAQQRQSFVNGLRDRRVAWVFAASVLMLGLIGLLIGKTVTPASHTLAPGAVPNPTAIALPSSHAEATPTPIATPQPTPQPTATPVPTPAAPNPNQLTGAQNLGAGGTGFTVNDIRYGAHPGDFRIVFDLSGNGSPTTTVGFGSPTTMYVIFSGTTGPATVAQPAAGNTATAVKLLLPSTIPGKTVYELTLSGPAKLSTMYLQSPLRLVIDLS